MTLTISVERTNNNTKQQQSEEIPEECSDARLVENIQ